MRNFWIRTIYAICLYFAATAILIALGGREESEDTQKMREATLPAVYFQRQEMPLDPVPGFTGKLRAGEYRSSLVPVGEDRMLTVAIDCGEERLAGIGYEVRSLAGDRLIEKKEIEGYRRDDDGTIRAEIALQDLLEMGEEYRFMLEVTMGEAPVRYYARILYASDSRTKDLDDALSFASEFHEKTMAGDEDGWLLTYLEPDASSPGSFSGADINSSISTITYGDLECREEMAPVFSFTNVQEDRLDLQGDFVFSAEDSEGVRKWFRGREYFRVRRGSQRFHLLDYKRSVTGVFDPSQEDIYRKNAVSAGAVQIGEAMESPSGKSIAFTGGGSLYGVFAESDTVAHIFGFADPESTDRRELFDGSRIRILSIDDDGNTDFIVYGYMNRGAREGSVGIAKYYFSREHRTLREQAFIAYDGSFEVLCEQMDRTLCMNGNGSFYFALNGKLLEYDPESGELGTAVEG